MSQDRHLKWKLHGTENAIEERSNDYGSWLEGVVITPVGIVEVHSHQRYNVYRFAYDGHLYFWSEVKPRSKKGLAVMARKWARGIVGESQQ